MAYGNERLTLAETKAALNAIGQMTGGNGHDFDEWRSQTSGDREEWDALRRAEEKLTIRRVRLEERSS